MNSTEIKACPFCGLPADTWQICTLPHPLYMAGCRNCFIAPHSAGYETTELAILEWNTRAGDRKPMMSEVEEQKALASATGSAATARMNATENGNRITMPGLSKMKRADMAKLIQSCWDLCDESMLPTHNGSRNLEWHVNKRGGMSLYGRLYCGLYRRDELLPNK